MEMKKNTSNYKRKVIYTAYIAMGAALLTICSWISIPIPVIPVTLQTFAVCLIAALFPLWVSLGSFAVFMFLGFIGLPVFSGMKNGAAAIASPTFGYLIGFLITIILVGGAIRIFGRKKICMFFSMILGVAVAYLFGSVWYWIFSMNKGGNAIGFFSVVMTCVVPFIIPDIIKVVIAVMISDRLSPVVNRMVINRCEK